MSYHLVYEQTEHVDMLKPLLEKIGKEEPDIFIVTEDGETVGTHKILLSLFSRTLSNILSGQPKDEGVPGISIPIKAETVRNLIKILEVGSTFNEDKEEVLAVANCGKLLGIYLENLQIVEKKAKKEGNRDKIMTKECQNKDIEETHIDGSDKSDQELEILMILNWQLSWKKNSSLKTKTLWQEK